MLTALSQRQLFLDHLAQTTHFPMMVEIVRAEGVYMYGPDGQRYLDLISGIGVSNVGHRHPRVVRAIKEQLDRYLHVMVYGEFVQNPQVQLAEALAQTLPNPLNCAYLVNSGSEAIEGALKLAKRVTGRPNFVSCYDAYHGSSQGALSVCGSEVFKQAYRPLLPGVRHMRFNQPEDLSLIDEQTAAVVIETVQGEAGVRVANADYFQQLRQRCDAVGALLILDEIQAGFGRTGTFWAFEPYGIVPDVVVAAKGMGGGMPIGAFIASHELMMSFRENPILGHISTFGGHPVSAAASYATLRTLLDEKLIQEVDRKAELIKQHLQHPAIREIRNRGLMMAVAFDSFEVLKPVIDRAVALGVITDWFLYCDSAMRIAPPLTISDEEIAEACGLVSQAIEEATSQSSYT